MKSSDIRASFLNYFKESCSELVSRVSGVLNTVRGGKGFRLVETYLTISEKPNKN